MGGALRRLRHALLGCQLGKVTASGPSWIETIEKCEVCGKSLGLWFEDDDES